MAKDHSQAGCRIEQPELAKRVGVGRRGSAMARSKLMQNVKPRSSDSAADKMYAAVNWPIGRSKRGHIYRSAPFYFDACFEWYLGLSGVQRGWVSWVVDAFTSHGEKKAERDAERLPAAPQYPL
jgi:hypothetical protein